MPLVTAEKSMNEAQVRRAITRAKVVLPTPGGPQKIIEGVRSASIMERRALPDPIWCDWPTTSSREVGRIRSARGRVSSPDSSNSECCWLRFMGEPSWWCHESRSCTQGTVEHPHLRPADRRPQAAIRSPPVAV